MDQLGFYPQLAPNEGITMTPKNATLHQLENTLANMVALVYWAGIHTRLKLSSLHCGNSISAAGTVHQDNWILNATAGSLSGGYVSVLPSWALVSSTETQLNVSNFELESA
jgi:hypothetical protein